MRTQAAIRRPDLVWSSLNVLNKQRYDFLVKHFGSLADALEKSDFDLFCKIGCKRETAKRAIRQISKFDCEKHEKLLNNLNIKLFSIESRKYPDSLRNLPDPPIFLFTRGNAELLNKPSIAIVGSRDMSTYGKRVVGSLVPEFVSAGFATVSGLAIGIDAYVAEETIAAGGDTIAVLGHGLGSIYPKLNEKLADSIVESGGLLVSEYPPATVPGKYTFPARNRIIAGISKGTIIAEAASQSGSLITASLALDYGREVFAVPGQIFDPHVAGAHQLIAKGNAKLITSARDVLSEFGIEACARRKKSSYRPQTPAERAILDCLSAIPQSFDCVAEKSGLPASKVNATLTLMEIKGGIKNIGMGMWVVV